MSRGGFGLRTRALLVAVGVAVGMLPHVGVLAASAGEIDPTFGTGGTYVHADIFAVQDVLVDESDYVYFAGAKYALGGSALGSAVGRLTPDGDLDTSYGSGTGATDVIFQGAVTAGRIYAIAQQSDGKILAAGTGDGRTEVALARFNVDGTLDATFGISGVLEWSVTEGYDKAYAIAVDPQGRVVVAGGAGDSMFVARVSSDGTMDTTFGTAGMVLVPAQDGAGGDAARDLLIQPDGRIVAAGSDNVVTSGLSQAMIVRLDDGGSFDTSFSDDGIHYESTGGLRGADAIERTVDGRYTVAADAQVARFDSDGSLDQTFGQSGVTEIPEAQFPRMLDLIVDSAGRIVTTGVDYGPAPNQLVVARLKADGTIDETFGTNGVYRAHSSIRHGMALAAQSDGHLVVAGNGDSRAELTRLVAEDQVNTAPVANDDGPFDVDYEGSVSGNVLTNDVDPNGPMTAELVSGPEDGVAILLPNGDFTYAPDSGFSGSDSFTYRADDGEDQSEVATVSFNVAGPGNTAPVANDDGPFQAVDGVATGDVLSNDTDDEGSLTAVLVSGPHDGEVALAADGTFVYEADTNFFGSDSFVYRAFDGELLSQPATVSISVAAVADKIGLVDPSTGVWRLDTASGEDTFFYGDPGDSPFVGDWDCDGVDSPGLFRQSDAYAYLRNSNSQGVADVKFFFGNPSDVPIAGDFNGDGCDTLSIYRPSEARFYIVNKLGQNDGGLGTAEYSFLFGNVGDKPVVGDWDGDGIDEIGLHRESSGFFYYRNSLQTGVADGAFYFGDPADKFVAGDWVKVDGADTPAIFRPSDATLYYRASLDQGPADASEPRPLADAGWLPVAGFFG